VNLVQGLARKHGLALYDPQSERVTYPDSSTGAKNNASRTSLWVLGLLALLFATMFVSSGQITPRYVLTNSDLSSHAINQLLGIVADPVLKHSLDVLDLVNPF
jgi:hypothetical protein